MEKVHKGNRCFIITRTDNDNQRICGGRRFVRGGRQYHKRRLQPHSRYMIIALIALSLISVTEYS